MKKTILALPLLLVPLLSQGQGWTLSQCIDYALEHSITVGQSRIEQAQREIDLSTATSSRLPSLSASAGENFSFGRGLTADNTYSNTNGTSTSLNLGADVPLFQGFRIRNNIALARLNLDAATADLQKAKDDIGVSVTQAFVQILYNMEILRVAEGQVEIDSLQAVRLEALLENGKASASELAQQKASLSQAHLQKTQAENNLRLSLLDLSQLLELPSPEGFSIVPPDPSVLSPVLLPTAEDIYADAVMTRPSVLAEKTRLDVASTRIDLAKGSFLPTLSLSGGIGSNYYTNSAFSSDSFAEQMKHNFSQFIGVSLTVPIFTRFANRNNLRSARLDYDREALQLESVKKSLYKEIQNAYYNAISAQQKLLSSRDVVASMEEAFELVSAKYENGKANITEFNEARNNLMKARSDLAQAEYEQLFQSRLLLFYRDGRIGFE